MTHTRTYAYALGRDSGVASATRARAGGISAQGFMRVDPLAEAMPGHSPYAYSFNSPITFSDASGLMPCYACDGGGYEGARGVLSSGSSNVGYQAMKDANQAQINNDVIRARIMRAAEQYAVDNPYAGAEVGRSYGNGQLNIWYAGRRDVVTVDAAERIAQIFSRTGAWASIASASTGAAAEFNHSPGLGTWRGSNGRTYSTRWHGNQYVKQRTARAAAGSLRTAGRALTAYSVGATANDWINGDIGDARAAGELGATAYATFGGIYGTAFGVGWESGRIITLTPGYGAWKRQKFLPWRQANLGY